MYEASYSSDAVTDAAVRSVAPRRWIPGELGIWAFILTDMCTFGFFFCAFAFERSNHRADFAHGRDALSLTSGALNTFLMLTASLCIAMSVKYVREANRNAARGLLLGAGLCGAAFIVHKGFEWARIAHHGFKPTTNHFFQLFYMLTGIHLVHVVIAMIVLAYLWRVVSRLNAPPTQGQARFIENAASYWHFVDLVWLVLFALLYLMK